MEVAKLVTQPFCTNVSQIRVEKALIPQHPGWFGGMHGYQDKNKHTWPLRVPLRISCSAIGAVLGSMEKVRRVRLERIQVEDGSVQ